MFVFIIPLKSPQACNDWPKLSALCERTLRSVCAQTVDRFRVILVGNQRPATSFSHRHLRIVEEDFPIPSRRGEQRMDHYRKLQRGLMEARKLHPRHLMFVDADDLVSRRLVEFAQQHNQAHGWSFYRGFLIDEGSNWALKVGDMHLRCGTCTIFRCRPEDFPNSMDDDSRQQVLLSARHFQREQRMAQLGRPLSKLPFAGSIYILGTGQNLTQFSLKELRKKRGTRVWLSELPKYRPLTRRLRRHLRHEFGFYQPAGHPKPHQG